MNKIEVYKSYVAFLNREDKRLNGVSEKFAKAHLGYVEDNITNAGCWCCYDCQECSDCEYGIVCLDCAFCRSCESCLDCSSCESCLDCSSCEFCLDCSDCKYGINCKFFKGKTK